ncbi:hypothetical protein BEWA_003130 [Theileria equi strain WA]|uniref:VPS9 domain-containing protein n=1 Tax=Theileria equi strain WA TaxID=1537102 RepID=L0AZD3_THEEQ|nr:hypothetical protein BEWA_003130 [Theileria equi strain WA]AFZ80905.1 hypothetical protein BEWA_003130 [Theileria equi strain WA]|eukprot:XP_004830571.1 hypothetical protein BEWA_003130 [Theileria equi strain WA]
MDDISTNPFMSILKTTYTPLYEFIFNDTETQKIIVIPASHSLVGVEITEDFIEVHVLQETAIENHYINLAGQAVEIDGDSVHTSYGFKNDCVCNIIKKDKIIESSKSVKVVVTDSHLLESNSKDIECLLYDFDRDVEKIVDRWSKENKEFHKTFSSDLERFRQTFVIVPGYESETANIISNMVDKSISKLLDDSKEYPRTFKDKIFRIALNYAYSNLHAAIWSYLTTSYSSKDTVIQNRITKLRNELNLNLSLLIFESRHEITKMNILPSAEALRKMENAKVPQEKLEYLDRAILLSNSSSSEDAVSLMILTIVVGGLKNPIAHAAYLDMYLKGRIVGKSESLEVLFSAISFLLN